MTWIVLIVGLSAQPTFRGEYSLQDCHHVAQHINQAYGSMVHAKCITKAEARRLGYMK